MKSRVIFFFFFTCFLQLQAQNKEVTAIYSHQLSASGVLLDEGWRLQAGDNPEWADTNYDHSGWQKIDPSQDIHDLPQLWQNNIVWYRLQFSVDSLLRQQSLVLLVEQTGASEIFLNGRLILRLGQLSAIPGEVQASTLPKGHMIALPLDDGPNQVLAVRFALQKDLPYLKFSGRPNSGLRLILNEVSAAAKHFRSIDLTISPLEYFRTGFFFILGILHLAFFWFYPAQRANLYFFLYAFLTSISSATGHLAHHVFSIETKVYLLVINLVIGLILNYLFYLTALYWLFKLRKGVIFWALSTGLILVFPLSFWFYDQSALLMKLFFFLVSLESIRVALIGIKRKQRGAKIVAVGALCFFVFYSLFTAMSYGYLPVGKNWIFGIWTFTLCVLSFPISISLFLAYEFAFTSRSLEKKLVEVQRLSEKTLAQKREKQRILAAQNETLEKQVAQRTTQVMAQKEELQTMLHHLRATQAQLIQSEKMASLGELTAGIAHEIQNPLNFVNNFSEVSAELLEELKHEANAEHKQEVMAIVADLDQNLRKIHHHGLRADAIVKNMLQHSRSHAGDKQLTNLNTLTEEYLRLAYYGARAKDKKFTCTLDTSFDLKLEKMEVVPQELGRVLLNLFNNAFYAVQQKHNLGLEGYEPKVRVSTRILCNKVEIRVWDNGTGIPEKVKNKIFQPFFTTKPAGQGIGLGLSLSYDIITKVHDGGELNVATAEGEWTEFAILLPGVTVAKELATAL